MKILVRVDAYPDIALGHLNRCINLGLSLERCGHNVVFLCYNDSATKEILSKTSFEYKFISSKINDKNDNHEEISQIKKLSYSMDLILVDSYSVDKEYFDLLNNFFSKIVYLDDLGLDFNVDMVVNPSCKVVKSDYKAKNVLCGMKYVILGDAYATEHIKIFNKGKISVLITMGGIDHYNLSSRIIPILQEISLDIEINMVIGPYYENIDLIKIAAKKSRLKVNFLENVTDLSSLIIKSDIALTAGGFTTYELAAMSTPSVGVALWKNQNDNVECLSSKGALIPLYYSKNKSFERELYKSFFRLIDYSLLETMSKKARIAVDGNGANRISQEITKYYEYR